MPDRPFSGMPNFEVVLRLKGWALFTILFAAALSSLWPTIVWGFSYPIGASPPVHVLAMTLVQLLYFGWLLALGASMNERLPESLRRGVLLPVLSLVIATGLQLWFAQRLRFEAEPQTFGVAAGVLNLLGVLAGVYLLWFASRSLVAAEENGKPSRDRTLLLFFVLWFSVLLPVGAWWAQDRARAVAANRRPRPRAEGTRRTEDHS